MAKMGRPPNAVKGIRWVVYIPEDIAAIAELDLLDPVRGGSQYGARSKLVEELLRKHYAERVKPQEGEAK